MSVYAEALSLVAALLGEAEDMAKPGQSLKVRVYWHEQFMDVPAVMLLTPQKWTSFITNGVHGMQNYLLRVDGPDRPDFCLAFQDLVTKSVPVPAKFHWALKMPGGYALLGEGNEAVTCTKKRQIISWDQQLVENPNLTPLQTRQWGMARKGL